MEANTNLSKVLNPRPVLSGMLLKYTNYVKGYQMRYFTVDATQGVLSYYLCEGPDENPQPVISNPPRGQIFLESAIICPSEDSRTFLINCANGEIIKLRAPDSRMRQEWVDGLRSIVQSHSQALSLATSQSPISVRDSLAAFDALDACRQQLQQTETCNANLIKAIENLGMEPSVTTTSSTTTTPTAAEAITTTATSTTTAVAGAEGMPQGDAAPQISATDPDLLMLKALSATTTTVLFQALGLLQKFNEFTDMEAI
ncbi:oxysterol-binding protein-related protein 11 isoform X2 [Culicoides brevitarsis]